MLLTLINIVFVLAYAWLIFYYRQGWLSLPETGIAPEKAFQTRISVVIAARNEEQNIRICLNSLSAQDYPSDLYEVIVVDDHSTDNTAIAVKAFESAKLIRLKDIVTGELNSYKKKAIETAIASATGELIVQTDADCLVPVTWLSSIASLYEKHQPVFIAAPVAYHDEKNFLQIFQSLDFMSLQGITGAAMHKRFHYMCNGANLAYKRTAFYEAGGFSGIDAIASGDDILLLQKIARSHPGKILFLKSRSAIVSTAGAGSVKEFLNQRIRWASKADKYPDKKTTGILLLVYFFNFWILLMTILAFLYPLLWVSLLGTLIIKTTLELLFLYPVSVFFQKQKLLWWFPVSQPFHIIYTVIAGWLGKFGSYTWKERRVK